jgi:hypothetical protein
VAFLRFHVLYFINVVVTHTLRRFVHEPLAQPRCTEASVFYKVLGTLRAICMKP